MTTKTSSLVHLGSEFSTKPKCCARKLFFVVIGPFLCLISTVLVSLFAVLLLTLALSQCLLLLWQANKPSLAFTGQMFEYAEGGLALATIFASCLPVPHRNWLNDWDWWLLGCSLAPSCTAVPDDVNSPLARRHSIGMSLTCFLDAAKSCSSSEPLLF